MVDRLWTSAYFALPPDARPAPTELTRFGITIQTDNGGNLTLVLGDDPGEAAPIIEGLLHSLEELAVRVHAADWCEKHGSTCRKVWHRGEDAENAEDTSGTEYIAPPQ